MSERHVTESMRGWGRRAVWSSALIERAEEALDGVLPHEPSDREFPPYEEAAGAVLDVAAERVRELEQRCGHLYGLLADLAEQLDWERYCSEAGYDPPRALSWRHENIEARVRDELAVTIQWWEHARPEQPHRLVGSAEPCVIARRWAQKPEPLLPEDGQ